MAELGKTPEQEKSDKILQDLNAAYEMLAACEKTSQLQHEVLQDLDHVRYLKKIANELTLIGFFLFVMCIIHMCKE